MIFRAAPKAEGGGPIWHAEGAETLFVLVVGETPTGGVHKEQFKNALRVIREIRGDDAIPENLKHLRILGITHLASGNSPVLPISSSRGCNRLPNPSNSRLVAPWLWNVCATAQATSDDMSRENSGNTVCGFGADSLAALAWGFL